MGSRPGGVSWVGAYDLSGNVWEWVSSAYEDYPYDPNDGREDLERTDVVFRVMRGGSFYLVGDFLRAAYRFGYFPDDESSYGFRCALSE